MRNVSRLKISWLAIIDRYMLKEFILNLTAVTGVLWLIYVSTRFTRYLAQAATGDMPADVIMDLLGYSSLGAISFLLPIGSFLAVMLTLGRMSSDSELTVMAACGVSFTRIVRNVMLFAGSVAVIVGILSLWVVPGVMSERFQVEQKAKLSANTTGLLAGSFKESHSGDWTFYSESLSQDKKSLENVFIQIKRKPRPLIFRAESGHFEVDSVTGDKFLILNNGYRYEGRAGDQDFVIAQFVTHSLLVEKGQAGDIQELHKTMATSALFASGKPRDWAELQWRFSMIVMTLLLSLSAIPLANAGPRQGRFVGFVPGVLIYILYSNLLGVNKAWVGKGQIEPWLGGLWVHLLIALVILVLFKQQFLRQFLRRRFSFK